MASKKKYPGVDTRNWKVVSYSGEALLGGREYPGYLAAIKAASGVEGAAAVRV